MALSLGHHQNCGGSRVLATRHSGRHCSTELYHQPCTKLPGHINCFPVFFVLYTRVKFLEEKMISPGCHVIPLPKEESILRVTVPFRDTRNDCLSREL